MCVRGCSLFASMVYFFLSTSPGMSNSTQIHSKAMRTLATKMFMGRTSGALPRLPGVLGRAVCTTGPAAPTPAAPTTP
jgi:hypothetical protein